MKALSLSIIAVVCSSATAYAQQLNLPDASPSAKIMQTVGLTDVTVVYHRPAVNGRPIWGKLVPYNEPWRCGANENTTVTFSSDVKIGGKALRAGTYGLHMIPTQKDWTIAFSNMSTAWGSYSYDVKEDALRVTVAPRAVANHVERLQYRFDDPGDAKATLVLAWEKLEVPLAIEIDTPKVVMASVRAQLRGQLGFTWQANSQAARYWLNNGGSLDEALKFVDASIGRQPTYGNYNVRAAILEKKGDAKGAAEFRAKALPLATENEVNQEAYRLVGQKKFDDAIKLLQMNIEKYPESWNAHDSLAEALATKGDKAGALAEYNKALAMTKDPEQKKRINAEMAKLK